MLRRSFKKHSSESNRFLVVGLGNPGKDYDGTRHNVGAAAVQALGIAQDSPLKKLREQALTNEIFIGSERVILAFPQTFMNNSGQSVSALMRKNGIKNPENLIVVHDEMDLPTGDLRIKSGGGLAGHNGLKSITAHLKTQDYLRIRIGVGKPANKNKGANYVLNRPNKVEQEELSIVIQETVDAIEAIISEGIDVAMARFNSRS
ncbi:MAG: aminoacyl-tRNA hydrolase [Acidimicrobiales bacterium]|tara:strand:+ start:558 stop:1169 length:612 start_codon:yes stop_codon:yes gene_type:complete